VAPAIIRSFCQLVDIDLRKMELKWFDKCDRSGILLIKVSKKFMIGFLRRTFSKIPVIYCWAWVMQRFTNCKYK
jgi:hypothetical protein